MILIWWPLGVNNQTNQTEVEGYYIENRFVPTLSWPVLCFGGQYLNSSALSNNYSDVDIFSGK
jgi:hypothetical protein